MVQFSHISHTTVMPIVIVQPQFFHSDDALTLECGITLDRFTLVYETYGRLNADRSNAILVCHALSGDHHAAGYHRENDKYPGWWDHYIGDNKPIDTNRFFVVACNNIGGCSGSTGPTSVNPITGRIYGPTFPIITVRDWVNAQARLADHLRIARWGAVIGGSLGGMQALDWSIAYPSRIGAAGIIAAAAKLSAQNIAFNEIARRAITTDPDFHDGLYEQHNTRPERGLMLARMLGHITYLSDNLMGNKFGRDMINETIRYTLDPEFQVESYLRHQGLSFINRIRFDANTYLRMTRALDYFDPARAHSGSLTAALAETMCPFLVIAFSSDWRFPPARSVEIVRALVAGKRPVSYAEIESDKGHDAFLLPNTTYEQTLRHWLRHNVMGHAA